MSSGPQAKETTDLLLEALRQRHEPAKRRLREWAYIEQVRSETWGARVADAVAMNLWESRGRVLHGFEVKATRTDWLKELKSPEKAGPIMAYCDFWWLVTIPDVVQLGELPSGWGLLLLRGKKLRAETQPEKREAKALDRRFIAEVIRRIYQVESQDSRLESVRQEGYNQGKTDGQRISEITDRAYRDLEKQVKEFEAAAGVRIGALPSPTGIGNAVRAVLQGDQFVDRQRASLLRLQVDASRVLRAIEERLVSLQETEDPELSVLGAE